MNDKNETATMELQTPAATQLQEQPTTPHRAQSMNLFTWCVTYWLSNDDETWAYWCRQARRHLRQADDAVLASATTGTAHEAARDSLAHQLRCHLFTETDILKHLDVYADLLLGALGEVDWLQIADYFLRESNAESSRNATAAPQQPEK